MDIEKLKAKRDRLVNSLINETSSFVNTFYIEKSTGFLKSSKLYSSYVTINNTKLIDLFIQKNPNLEVMENVDPEISMSNTPNTNLRDLLKYQKEMKACLFVGTFEQRIYVRSDEYTNNLIINYLISYIYDHIPLSANIRGSITLYDSTIYESSSGLIGLNLYEEGVPLMKYLEDIRNFNWYHNIDIFIPKTRGTSRMRVLTADFVLDLFKQVLVNLQLLQSKYSFNHGELTRDKIIVTNNPVMINYSTIRHISKLTFKISDFRYSSLNLSLPGGKNIRVHGTNKYAETYLSVFPFRPTIDRSLNESYYILDDLLNIQMLANIRYLGTQFYSSFDTMTLLLSLLMLPQVYYEVFTNPLLKSIIWGTMWHPKDESLAFEQLTKIVLDPQAEGSYDDILNLLRSKWIKCKLTDDLVINLSRSYNIS